MGSDNRDGNRLIKANFTSNEAAKLKESVMEKLKEFMGDYFDDTFVAKCLETGETIAIKKVLQDKRYNNRELQIMRLLDHPNVVSLKHCFFSTTDKDELYLNLVLEYVPKTVCRVVKYCSKANQWMPLIYVKLYTYQPLFPGDSGVDQLVEIIKASDVGSGVLSLNQDVGSSGASKTH